MQLLRTAALSAALVCIAAPAASAELALDVYAGIAYSRGSFTNFGWSFTSTEARRITALAVWDRFSNGLADDHPVGIWQLDGDLVVSATVTGIDPLVGSFSGGVWRTKSVPLTYLPAGNYVIGAYYPTAGDAFVTTDTSQTAVTVLVRASWLSFGEGRIESSIESLVRPDTVASAQFQPSFFGPNFLSIAVPEPATWAMMIAGFGLVGSVARHRRRTVSGC